jgi:ankyrin repeat protein
VTNQSPLIVACNGNKKAVVKLLLSYEACDVNIIDNNNCNALHYACREGQSQLFFSKRSTISTKPPIATTPPRQAE